jgi:hypothetical protein
MIRSSRHVKVLVPAIAVLLAGAAMAGAPAGAATDVTPPVWTKIPAASIPVGAVLDSWDCDGVEFSLTPVHVDYQARDPESGIDHYEMATDQGNGPEDVGLVTRATMTARTTDPADCFGGPRPIFSAYAVNGAGLENAEYAWQSSQLVVIQDKASNNKGYTQGWKTSHCACWSGGTTHKTRKKNAALRATLLAPDSAGTPSTSALALIMATGPNRGRATVWLDGVKVATVRTHSTVRTQRTVVWRQSVAPGVHVVRVVNQATPGHPRIDIDALVLLPKGSQSFG